MTLLAPAHITGGDPAILAAILFVGLAGLPIFWPMLQEALGR